MSEKTKIKVAYILTPITFGGSEKVSLNFLKTVDRNRFDILPVLLLRPWEEPPLFAQEIVKLGYEYLTLPVSLLQGGDPLRVPRVAWRLTKLLRVGKFDLVHTHGYFADICAIPVARMLGIKTITTCHGFIFNNNKLKLYNKLNVCAIKLCHRVIAVSEDIKDQLVAAGLKPLKITVISNAVEAEFDGSEIARLRKSKRNELQIKDDEFVVGFLGRLSAEKGVEFLIDAVTGLVDDGLPIRLLIVGEGDERKNLEAQVAQKSIAHRVIFAGFQSNTESWLSSFDLFALPSLTEGTPMALLEAMAMGVPVVASNIGGVPKVVTDAQNGLLVESGSSESIIKAISRILHDPILSEKMSTEAQKEVKAGYQIGSWAGKIEKLYLVESI